MGFEEIGKFPVEQDISVLLNRIGALETRGFIRMEYVSTTEQTLTSGTITVVEYDTITHQDDPQSDFTGDTSTGEITVNRDGLYLIDGAASIRIGSAPTRRLVQIYVNGNALCNQEGDATATGARGSTAVIIYPLVVGDVVDIRVVANGTTLAVADSPTTHFAITRLG